MRILYAEDKPDYARDQKLLLNRWGYSVNHVSSQTEGTASIEGVPHQIDIGLFDMRMESWTSGVELTKLMHKSFPEAPVIILTAYAEVNNYASSTEAGAFTYVDKDNAAVYLRPSLLRAAAERTARLRRLLDRAHAGWWASVGMAEVVNGDETIRVRHGLTALALARLKVPPPPAANSPEMDVETLFRLFPGGHGGFGDAKIRTSLGRAIDPTPLQDYLSASGINGVASRVCAIVGDWAQLDIVYPHAMERPRLDDMNRMLSGHISLSEDEIRFSVFPMELTAIGAIAWATADQTSTTISICIQMRQPNG